jgi:hypothetical protein
MDRLELRKALASLSEAKELVAEINHAIRFPNSELRQCANPGCGKTFKIANRLTKKYCSRRCRDVIFISGDSNHPNARQKRYRARQNLQIRVINIEVHRESLVNALINAGRLKQDQASLATKKELGIHASEILAEWAADYLWLRHLGVYHGDYA